MPEKKFGQRPEDDDRDPVYEADKIARKDAEKETEAASNEEQRRKLAAEQAASAAARQGESCPKKGGAVALLTAAILMVPSAQQEHAVAHDYQRTEPCYELALPDLAIMALEKGVALTASLQSSPDSGRIETC